MGAFTSVLPRMLRPEISCTAHEWQTSISCCLGCGLTLQQNPTDALASIVWAVHTDTSAALTLSPVWNFTLHRYPHLLLPVYTMRNYLGTRAKWWNGIWLTLFRFMCGGYDKWKCIFFIASSFQRRRLFSAFLRELLFRHSVEWCFLSPIRFPYSPIFISIFHFRTLKKARQKNHILARVSFLFSFSAF